MYPTPPKAKGIALIELVITIVVLGLISAGAMVAINNSLRLDIDPVAQRQALAIAESYLEREMLRNYNSLKSYQDDPAINVRNNQPFDDLKSYTVEVDVTEKDLAPTPDPSLSVRGKWITARVSGLGLEEPLILSLFRRHPNKP